MIAKTTIKLVWSAAAVVLILGLVRAAMVFEKSQQTDRGVVIRKSK